MKNYREMSADVFRRRDEWARKRRQRNRILLRTGSVCGICVLLLSAGMLVPAMMGVEKCNYSPNIAGDHAADDPNPDVTDGTILFDADLFPAKPITLPAPQDPQPSCSVPMLWDDSEIIFNIVPSYTTPGKRLVERVTVSAEEFALVFPLDVSGFPPDAEYAFEYGIDPDTLAIDKTALENGVVTVRDARTGESCHFCISDRGAIHDSCILPDESDAEASILFGKEVLLFHLLGEKELIFGEFRLKDLDITCTFWDCDKSNAVNLLENLIESNLTD